jgi:Cellulase (glycosyl hydrolase family 5)
MRRLMLASTFLAGFGTVAYGQTVVTPNHGTLKDASGNTWGISSDGSILETLSDGQSIWTPGGGGTAALTIVNGVVYGQDNGSGPVDPGGWFALSGNGEAWSVSPTPPNVAPNIAPSVSPASSVPTTGATASSIADYVPACTTGTVPNSPATNGGFGTINGQIYTPGGQVFVPRGINVMDSQMGAASQILADFPGINFIRLNVYSYQPPSAYQAFISTMTAHGVVVELEDHTGTAQDAGGGDQGGNTVFAGQQLTNELNWYSSIASAFASNPYVWIGTDNEPAEATSPNGSDNPAALAQWQLDTYNAIRNAGNNSPIMLEDQSNLPASYYAGMTNTIWDDHYYGWESGNSTNQSTVNSSLASSISAIQQIQSADGVMPVIVGEYGPSTNGQTNDANGSQVLQAVQSSGVGSVAWGYDTGVADNLTDGSGMTSFGAEVAGYIGTTPACAQSPVPTVSATPATTSSAVTAPALAAASTAVTAPALPSTSSSTVTAPTLPPNSLSIAQVAALATGGTR